MRPRAPHSAALVLAAAMLMGAAPSGDALGATAPWVDGRVLVRWRPEVRAAERGAARARAEARPLAAYPFIDAELLEVSPGTVPAAVARLSADPRVAWAEPDYVVEASLIPDDPRFGEQWPLRNTGQSGGTPGADIRAPIAWDTFTGDTTVLIGVIDTGIELTHPDLAGNLWTNPGEIPDNQVDDDANGYVDDVHGFDFANLDSDPTDDHGHGSHVSGILAARGNDGVGIAGVCWRARLVAIKFLSSGGRGSVSGAVAAVQYAIRVGVRVANNSWGGPGSSQGLLDALDAAGASGMLVVAAAGNAAGDNDAQPTYPASYDRPFIVAVAATDANDGLAVYSNFGATSVDLGAPGSDVLSLTLGGGYNRRSGTSMSTPLVSGAAALVWGRFPAMSALEVKDRILASVRPLPGLAGRCVSGGRLDLLVTVADRDSVPPGRISDLAAVESGSNHAVLEWTATGDDAGAGSASDYELRFSTTPLDSAGFDAATRVGTPEPGAAGTRERVEVRGLLVETPYWFAVRAHDEFGNPGPISNVVSIGTLGAPALAHAPDSFEVTVDVGALTSRTLTLSNLAQGTLDWEAPAPELAILSRGPQPEVATAKGEDGPAGDPVIAGRGGPDGFGFRWLDSDEPDGPAFAWEDPAGLEPVELSGDDILSAPIPIGFEFPFYGGRFHSVRVCTNGFLSFSDTRATYSNQPLPSLVAPADLVAPLWDDLDFGEARRAYARASSGRFTVTWMDVPRFFSGERYTFQVTLLRSGEIRFRYFALGDSALSATVGLQGASRDVGTQVAFNTAYLHDSLEVRLVPLPQWLTVSPASGRIAAGSSQQVEVRISGSGLPAGPQRGTVILRSNDPARPEVELPVRLQVIGAPDLVVAPPALDFGSPIVGQTATRTLTVTNAGTDSLHVRSAIADHPAVSAAPGTFVLPTGDSRGVEVRFAPLVPGALASTLTLASDDPDSPALSVPLTGEAVAAPDARAQPESVVVALAPGDTAQRTVRVVNRGEGPYTFLADVVPERGDAIAAIAVRPLLASGPDASGYSFRDSDAPGGPAFAWEDIRLTGVRLPLSGEDARHGPVPIGFSFPFYGALHDRLWVCTNGWVSFSDEALVSPSNTSLPSAAPGVPSNLLAVFWDDLVFGAERSVWVRGGPDRCVIQFQDVHRFGPGESNRPNTFQVVLTPDGVIEYRYLEVRALVPTSATVGIQNAARDAGLEVVRDATWLRDSLAVRFTPPVQWLTVTPSQGGVGAGDSVDFALRFEARGLLGGTHRARLRLSGNSPARPLLDVPCALEVEGIPAVGLGRDALDFAVTWVGHPATRTLLVRSAGNQTLRVGGIAAHDPRVHAEPPKFELAPGESLAVRVRFEPEAEGTLDDSLEVLSDDPRAPRLAVALTGRAALPPRAEVAPAALAEHAASGLGPAAAVRERSVAIRNTGASPLRWRATVVSGPSIAAAPPLEAEAPKGAGDPPGALGEGGPDPAGYAWVDSDAPQGPAFAWATRGPDADSLAFDHDDQTVAGVRLPFRFPFYGQEFDSLNVCTNGWVSFTSTRTTYTNTSLPNAGLAVPENLVAVLWDDLVFDSAGGPATAWAGPEGDRFVVAWEGVRRIDGAGPFAFQVALHPGGEIDLQYLRVPPGAAGATAGIQDATRTRGLQVVWNAAYLHDGLRVRIARLEPWLGVSPDSGITVPGGTDTVQVRFAASELERALVRGEVRIESDDPERPVFAVPCVLEVGAEPVRASWPPPPWSPALLGDSLWARIEAPALDAPRLGWIGAGSAPPRRAADGAWAFAFATLDARRSVAGDGALTLAVEDSSGWRAARDTLPASEPRLLGSPPLRPLGGAGDTARVPLDTTLTLDWEEPAGSQADRWHAWLSTDGGARWQPLALGLEAPRLVWTVREGAARAARLELTGMRDGRLVSSWVSEAFALVPPNGNPPEAPPRAFALRLTGPHPARQTAAFVIELPVAARVNLEVMDVRGARVRRLAAADFPAGRHPVTWDGRDAGGAPVAPGLYFVRARAAGWHAVQRLVLLR